jgi:hypothetical protein
MAELRRRPLQTTDRDGVMRRSHNSVAYKFELLEEFRTPEYKNRRGRNCRQARNRRLTTPRWPLAPSQFQSLEGSVQVELTAVHRLTVCLAERGGQWEFSPMIRTPPFPEFPDVRIECREWPCRYCGGPIEVARSSSLTKLSTSFASWLRSERGRFACLSRVVQCTCLYIA